LKENEILEDFEDMEVDDSNTLIDLLKGSPLAGEMELGSVWYSMKEFCGESE